MADIFSPFSSSALASLPKTNRRKSRTMSNDAAEGPATNGYQATGSTQRRQPAQSVQAAPTPIKVEPKVWFANERSEQLFLHLLQEFPAHSPQHGFRICSLCSVSRSRRCAHCPSLISNTGILLGTMALVLFNAVHDNITRYFAYAYAVISVLVMVRSLLEPTPITRPDAEA